MTTRRVRNALIVTIDHVGYDCRACGGEWHDAGGPLLVRDPNYDTHLPHQSRAGVQRWRETLAYDLDAPALVPIPVCDVLPAGEY